MMMYVPLIVSGSILATFIGQNGECDYVRFETSPYKSKFSQSNDNNHCPRGTVL